MTDQQLLMNIVDDVLGIVAKMNEAGNSNPAKMPELTIRAYHIFEGFQHAVKSLKTRKTRDLTGQEFTRVIEATNAIDNFVRNQSAKDQSTRVGPGETTRQS